MKKIITFTMVMMFVVAGHALSYPIIDANDSALVDGTLITFSEAVSQEDTYDIVHVNANYQLTNTYDGQYGMEGLYLSMYTDQTIQFRLHQPITAFGFNMGAINTDWTLTARDLNLDVIETYSINYTYPYIDGYYGFSCDEDIYDISLTANARDWVLIDNFTYNTTSTTAPVPEPATILLIGTGLVGLIGYGKRKARTMK